MPVLGPPTESLSCPSCLDDFDARELWKSLLLDFDNDVSKKPGKVQKFTGLGSGPTGEMRRAQPTCTQCGADIPEPMLSTADAQTFSCAQCGASIGTAPIPEWLQRLVPTAKQFYRSGAWAGHEGPAASLADDIKPVVMNCPQCAGSLQATTASKRIMTCQYCSAEVYLPDAVWKRLHPAPKIEDWFVRFEGPSEKERNRRAERQQLTAAAELDRKAREETQARIEQQRLDREAQAHALLLPAWLFLGLAWLSLATGWLSLLGTGDVKLPLIGIVAISQGLASWMVAKPVRTSAGDRAYGFEWALFAIHLWVLFSLMPIIGVVIGLYHGVRMVRGRIESFSVETTSGSSVSSKSYETVELGHREGWPAAALFLGNVCAQLAIAAVLVLGDAIRSASPGLVEIGQRIAALFG